MMGVTLLLPQNFNSHAHVERDGTHQKTIITEEDFNSHAHVERDGTHQKTIITEEDFNSHAHVERDDTMVVMLSISRISTHTLTWSVTRLSATLQKMYQYFNSHAHVERDCIVYPVNSNFYDFNSHAHVERDCETPPTPMPPHSFQLTRSRGA